MQRKSWSIHMFSFSQCVTNAYISLIHLLNKTIAPSVRVTIWGSSLEREHCAQTKNGWNPLGITCPLSLFPLPSLPLTLFLQLNIYTTIIIFLKAIHDPVAYFTGVVSIVSLSSRNLFHESREYKLTIQLKSSQLTFKLQLEAISYSCQ